MDIQTHTWIIQTSLAAPAENRSCTMYHNISPLIFLSPQIKTKLILFFLYKAQIQTCWKTYRSKINLHIRIQRTKYKSKKKSENKFVNNFLCFLHIIADKAPKYHNVYTDIKKKNNGRTTEKLGQNSSCYAVKEFLFHSDQLKTQNRRYMLPLSIWECFSHHLVLSDPLELFLSFGLVHHLHSDSQRKIKLLKDIEITGTDNPKLIIQIYCKLVFFR